MRPFQSVLSEKMVESLRRPIPAGTSRQVVGYPGVPGKALAVIGMRRAGKTTFVHQVRRDWVQRGHSQERLPYVNFEDERLVGLTADDLTALLSEYKRTVAESDSEPTLWALDEVQVVPGWERFVRRLLDTPGHEVIVTGSSAAMLSREVATSLRGRAWEVAIYPFSLEEAARHRGERLPEAGMAMTSDQRAEAERITLTWLRTGGFPEAQDLSESDRWRLLESYVDVAILRDVVERHRVTNVQALRWLVRQLLANAGGSFSVGKFHRVMHSEGISVSKDTVHEFLAHLEDCFLVQTVWMEADSDRKRMVNPRKCYPIDCALIPLYDRTGRANLGHALETATLIELVRRRCYVSYVKSPSGFEVDFLARYPGQAPELIQVCADPSPPETLAREIRALMEGRVLIPGATATLLTLTRFVGPLPAGVRCLPYHEWCQGAAERPD